MRLGRNHPERRLPMGTSARLTALATTLAFAFVIAIILGMV